jgi:uncharacterized protein YjiS (DUF1127 family)
MQLNWLEAELERAPPALRQMTNSEACAGRAQSHESWLAWTRGLLRLWRERVRQRVELTQLSACERRDLGVSDADVWAETEKWFWQE